MILVPECGGAAALSFIRMCPLPLHSRLLLQDTNPKALEAVAKASGLRTWDNTQKVQYIAPTSEYPLGLPEAAQFNPCYQPSARLQSSAWVHDKKVASELLRSKSLRTVYVPKPLGPAFRRARVGAGSVGASPSSNEDYLCELMDIDYEYVIDFNAPVGCYIPRKVLLLSKGADKVVELLGYETDDFKELVDAATEVVEALGISGLIGNVQLGRTRNGTLFFIEAAARLSGSSKVCLTAGGNVLLGVSTNNPFTTTHLIG